MNNNIIYYILYIYSLRTVEPPVISHPNKMIYFSGQFWEVVILTRIKVEVPRHLLHGKENNRIYCSNFYKVTIYVVPRPSYPKV